MNTKIHHAIILFLIFFIMNIMMGGLPYASVKRITVQTFSRIDSFMMLDQVKTSFTIQSICTTDEDCPLGQTCELNADTESRECVGEPVVCGDNVCEYIRGEDAGNCPSDCICDEDNYCEITQGENDGSCIDCGCDQDQICEPDRGETTSSCSTDCGCNNNTICEPDRGENITTCPNDCGSCNENGICEPSVGETTTNCAVDCGCDQDGICEDDRGETTTNCAVDCSCDQDGICEDERGENSQNCLRDCPVQCNNNEICDYGEYAENCPGDCGCDQDQICESDRGELYANCEDCGATCNNNGICDIALGEDAGNCPVDCGCNNNTICEQIRDETRQNCPGDCPGNSCNNNGTCDPGEIFPGCNDCDQDICDDSEFNCNSICGELDLTPMDIFFVLDNSTSMDVNERRTILKKATKNIINFLDTGDRVSIVEFNNSSIIKQPLSQYLGYDNINNIIQPIDLQLTNYVQAYNNLTQEIINNSNSFSGRKQLVFFISDGQATIGGPGCATNEQPCQINQSKIFASQFKIDFPNIDIVAIGMDPTGPEMIDVLENYVTRNPSDYYQVNSLQGASCENIESNVDSIIYAARQLLCTYSCVDLCGNGVVEAGEQCDDGNTNNNDGCSATCSTEGYDLALTKVLSDINQKVVSSGDKVTFDIQIINQGNINAKEIVITDYIPVGLTLITGNGWIQSGTKASYNVGSLDAGATKVIKIGFIVNGTAKGEIRNWVEISKDDGDDKDSNADDNKDNDCYGGDNIVSGNGNSSTTCNEKSDEDDHDDAVISTVRCGNGVVEAGEGCDDGNTNNNDGCSATCSTEGYDLALTKVLSDINQKVVSSGDKVTFDIQIINQGNINAKEIVITDYIPVGLTLITGNGWIQSGTKASYNVGSLDAGATKVIKISFIVNGTAKGEIRNWVEISKDDGDDKDSNADDNKDNDCYGGDNIVSGNGNSSTTCNEKSDEDDHDDAVISTVRCGNGVVEAGEGCDDGNTNNNDGCSATCSTEGYDLALTKVLSDINQKVVSSGDKVTFDIQIINQGNINAKEIVITDYIPVGLTLITGNGWIQSGTKASYNVGSLDAGATKVIKISFIVNGTAKGEIRNWVEISKDDGDDKDSNADDNKDNDCYGGDNIVSGNGNSSTTCNEKSDEDDHDDAVISTVRCGNGVVEAGEECDGSSGLLGNEQCTATCYKRCPVNTSYCPISNDCRSAITCTDKPICNNDGICTENEDCRCSDCGGKQDSCQNGLNCQIVSSYTSVATGMVCTTPPSTSGGGGTTSFGGGGGTSITIPTVSTGTFIPPKRKPIPAFELQPPVIEDVPFILPETGSREFYALIIAILSLIMISTSYYYHYQSDQMKKS